MFKLTKCITNSYSVIVAQELINKYLVLFSVFLCFFKCPSWKFMCIFSAATLQHSNVLLISLSCAPNVDFKVYLYNSLDFLSFISFWTQGINYS